MGKDPSDIRAQIEETRARVGDEVDALSYKTDVPARVGDYVDEKKQAVKDKVTGFKEAVTGTASSAVDSVAGTAASAVPNRQQVGRVKDTAERNPLGLAVGAASLGFVAGMLIPSTRVENEHMGEVSDRVIDPEARLLVADHDPPRGLELHLRVEHCDQGVQVLVVEGLDEGAGGVGAASCH